MRRARGRDAWDGFSSPASLVTDILDLHEQELLLVELETVDRKEENIFNFTLYQKVKWVGQWSVESVGKLGFGKTATRHGKFAFVRTVTTVVFK